MYTQKGTDTIYINLYYSIYKATTGQLDTMHKKQ